MAGSPVSVNHRSGFTPRAEGFALSLSRSEDAAMCAVSRGAPVGIDVERLRSWPELDEMAALIDHGAAQDAQGLLELWTRKEALAKAMGTGLPDDVRLLRVPQQHVEAGSWLREAGWLWIGCPCEPGHVASLVVRSEREDGRGSLELGGPCHEAGAIVWSFRVPA